MTGQLPASPHCVVFDSGMGGLTVVRELQRLGFTGALSYAADTGFFPYGDKSDADLTRRVPRFASAVMRQGAPDIFVIACNTASTLALSVVRAVIPIPVVGTVPAIKPAAARTKTGVIGVLATPGTLRRAYTDALVHEFARDHTVITHGSVVLVELAEAFAAGEIVDMGAMKAEIDALLSKPQGDKLDTIVLACTHFPLLKDQIQALVGPDVTLIDSGEAIARRTLSLLGQTPKPGNYPAAGGGRLFLSPSQKTTGRLETVARSFGFDEVEFLDEI